MDNQKIVFSDLPLHVNLHTLEFVQAASYRDLHIHNEIELAYVEEGELLCQVNEDALILPEGSLLLVNSRIQHRLAYCGSPCKCTYLQIDIAQYAPLLFPDSRIQLPLLLRSKNVRSFGTYSHPSEIVAIFNAIVQELREHRPHREVYVKAGIFQLIAFLCRHDFYAESSEVEANIQSILPAITYIEANYQQKLELDDVSSTMHISKYHFCKRFRAATGMTFSAYVNALRIYHAQTLLLDSQKSISDIAYECGFGSTQNFNHFFKKSLGQTPKAYRNLKTVPHQKRKA